MKKQFLSIILLISSIVFVGCGGGGGSSSDKNSPDNNELSQIDIEGEWNYISTLVNCDKQESGVVIIEKVSTKEFNWSISSTNGLEADCSYSGNYSAQGTVYEDSNNMTLANFNTYLTQINSTTQVTNVTFNSSSKITTTETYNGGNFTSIFTRDDSAFNGNTYSGYYMLESGSIANCGRSGSVNISIINSKVTGTATTSEGTLSIDGFDIGDGKYSGTTNDGTSWSGRITSTQAYGTYTNSTWNCKGTYTLTKN